MGYYYKGILKSVGCSESGGATLQYVVFSECVATVQPYATTAYNSLPSQRAMKAAVA